MIQHPYTQAHKRKGNFVLAVKPSALTKAKMILGFKPAMPKFVAIDTEKKNYKMVDDITQASAFKYHDAIEGLTKIKIKNLNVWLILWDGKNWILR